MSLSPYAGEKRRPSSTDLWRLAWQVGGPTQRVFAVIAGAAPPLSGILMVVAMVPLYARGGIDGVYRMFYVGFIAIAAWTAFRNPILTSMRGPAFWRERIESEWVPPASQDFYRELARYKEERGVGGQLPGDMAWGSAYFAIYLGSMIFGILLVWFLPTWSDFAVLFLFSVVEFPLAFACLFVYGRRNRRQFDWAVSAGYSFAHFRLGALRKLQP